MLATWGVLHGLEVKYDGGPPEVREALDPLAERIARIEDLLLRVMEYRSSRPADDRQEEDPELEALESELREYHSNLMKTLDGILVTLPR